MYEYVPNYAASLATFGIPKGPVQTSANLPAGLTLQDNINGVFNGVFAYGGATMFNELMAEMRRPYDFWKALIISEIFITAVYLIFGLVVYSKQGQFTYNPAFQGKILLTDERVMHLLISHEVSHMLDTLSKRSAMQSTS